MESAARLLRPTIRRYRFGAFTVDVVSGELRNQGSKLKLSERPFRLLLALLEQHGEVVSREELRRQLWPEGTFVDFDHSLSNALNKVRGTLQDSATHPRYIETVGRRGYRFVYPVTEEELRPVPVPVPTSKARNRAGLIALVGIVGTATIAAVVFNRQKIVSSGNRVEIRSLAVLPLKNLSNDPEQQYFSEGLTDELITRLAALEGLRVISHTSVMQYQDTRKSLPVIARELNVDAVVEGTVLRSGGRVRITAQLIEAAADRHMWAQSYERDEHDILDLQSEVTRDIAKNIRLNLKLVNHEQPLVSRSCEVAAYDLYLRGQYFWNKRTVASLREANNYYRQATAKDPNCALAYVGVANSSVLLGEYSGVYQPKSAREARAAALRALQIDESLPEAHTALALIVENYDWDWQRAEDEFRRAIELNPNYATAHHWYAENLMWRGRFNEAMRESESARQLDPFSPIIAADNGAILYYARDYDRAIAQFRSVLKQVPHFPRAGLICYAYSENGMFPDALAEVNEYRKANGDGPWPWSVMAYIYGRSGKQAQAKYALNRLLEFERRQPADPTMLATAFLATGQKDQALAALEKAASEQPNALSSLKVEPIYDPLRHDPRFQDLLRRVGLAQ